MKAIILTALLTAGCATAPAPESFEAISTPTPVATAPKTTLPAASVLRGGNVIQTISIGCHDIQNAIRMESGMSGHISPAQFEIVLTQLTLGRECATLMPGKPVEVVHHLMVSDYYCVTQGELMDFTRPDQCAWVGSKHLTH
jgi:hypothetical protein